VGPSTVAEAPSWPDAAAVSVNEGSSASLTIADALSEVDTTPAWVRDHDLQRAHRRDLQSRAVPRRNTWTSTPATDLTGLQITIPDSDQGNFTLSVVRHHQ